MVGCEVTSSAPESPSDIYSPISFASKTEAARFIKAVTDFDEVERKHNQSLHDLPRQAADLANQAGCDTSQKLGFLGAFNARLDGFLKAEDKFMITQHQWVQDTVELYEFTSKYSGKIATQNDDIIIIDAYIRSQFNSKLSKCRSSYSRLQAVGKEYAAFEKSISR